MQINIGNWFLEVFDKELALTSSTYIEGLIASWTKIFPGENSWVQKNQGVPSLIIRLDMAVNSDGIGVYEIEERPDGIGVACLLNNDFKNRLSDMTKEWRVLGNIGIVVSGRRLETSADALWASEIDILFFGNPEVSYLPSNLLYWVRANRDEEKYYVLTPLALSTIALEGDKRYGVHLGLWDVLPKNQEELPWKRGFVLKPAVGSRMEDVYIWHPDGKKKFDGVATRKKITNVIREKKVTYVQDFISPEQHSFLPEGYFLIRRVYWAWSPIQKKYICIGGLWTARKNLRIHGSSDAIFGPIVVV